MSNSDYQKLLIEHDDQEKKSPITTFLKPFLKQSKAAKANNEYDLELDQYLPLPNQEHKAHEEQSINEFYVEYGYFPKKIGKRQVRCKGQENQQRLDRTASKIKLYLIFSNPVKWKDILRIELMVHRANSIPNHINLYTGYATLEKDRTRFFQQEQDTNEIVIISDLDSVYSEGSTKVYELSRSNPKYNEFEVQINVYFHCGAKTTFVTKPFLVVGIKPEKAGAKRNESMLYDDDDAFERTIPRSNKYFKDPSSSENFPQVQKLVTDIVQAKQGIFDQLYAPRLIKTGNGDIAYHFKLKDQFSNEDFEAGEVIGFTVDSLGHVVIQKLTLHNAKDVFLRGVVTNSQYLECNLQEEGKTATVCMLGLVKVKVIGSVYQGEGLYASADVPGAMVSEHQLSGTTDEREHHPALVAHAFQKVECDDFKIHYVQALVSIVDCAGYNLMQNKLNGLETKLKVDMSDKWIKNRKKSRKRFCCMLVTATLLVLLSVLLYQLTVPGSAYKKWQCKRGSIGTSSYWYWLQGYEFYGVEFGGCKDVWSRAIDRHSDVPELKHFNHKSQCLNGSFHYFINLDSCAGKINPGARYFFAIDKDCTQVWQFSERLGEWKRDDKVCSFPKCNIKCSYEGSSHKSSETCDIDAPCIL